MPAEGAACLWNVTMRGESDRAANQSSGALFAVTAVCNGGTGARPSKDGLSATAYPSGVRGTPVEINEQVSPVVFWRKELRPDSGGHGRRRGGLGQVIEIESAIGKDLELLASFDRVIHPPRGRYGGHDGDRGGVRLASGAVLNGKGTQRIAAGERLVLHTPGGAGFGDPHERDPAEVAADLAAGRISPETAKAVHGVDVEAEVRSSAGRIGAA